MQNVAATLRTKQQPLFVDTQCLTHWLQHPERTVKDWMAQHALSDLRPFRKTSIDTYWYIFKAWLAHLDATHVTLVEADTPCLEAFLRRQASETTLADVSQWRYLQWLDRVYAHLKTLDPLIANPASPLLRQGSKLKAPPPAWLTPGEIDALLTVLGQLPGWRGQRDRALASLLLGMGLRVNEVLAAQWYRDTHSARVPDFSRLDAPSFTQQIRPEGVHLERVAQMLPGCYRDWWLTWAALPRTSPLVIPSRRSGTSTLSAQFSAAGLFLRVRTWGKAAGIENLAPQILRNTYARLAWPLAQQQLHVVQSWMGHVEAKATARLLAKLLDEAPHASA